MTAIRLALVTIRFRHIRFRAADPADEPCGVHRKVGTMARQRLHLLRFHGVLEPNAMPRARGSGGAGSGSCRPTGILPTLAVRPLHRAAAG